MNGLTMDELIKNYKRSLRVVHTLQLKANSEDRRLLDEMAADLNYAIDWMNRGRCPGNRRGVENKAAYQREVLWSQLSEFTKQKLEMRESRKRKLSGGENLFLDQILTLLSPTEYEAFIAVRGQCLSFTQVANVMHCSKASVQSYVRRAEKKLRKIVKKDKNGQLRIHIGEVKKMNEMDRQELIRGFEKIDEAEDVVKLYRNGWSVVEIAGSKDATVQSTIDILQEHAVSIKPKHLEEAEVYLQFEKASDDYTIRRIK